MQELLRSLRWSPGQQVARAHRRIKIEVYGDYETFIRSRANL